MHCSGSVRTLCLFGILGIPGACSTPGPSPADWEAHELPKVELDAEARARVRSQTEAARQALAGGRVTEAARIAERVLRIDPRAAFARAILGTALLEPALAKTPPDLAWLERAEGELRLARRLAPGDPQIAMLYSQFLEVDGQISLAAKVVDEVLKASPNYLQALRDGSRLHYELGHERQAALILERLVDRVPSDSEARYRLAVCQFRLAEAMASGDTEIRVGVRSIAQAAFLRSADSYVTYTRLQPTDMDGFLGEAMARFRAAVLSSPEPTKQSPAPAAYAEIVAILTSAARVRPESPSPIHNQAVVHQHFGNQDKARSCYEAALELDKHFLPSMLNLAVLLDAAGEKPAARDLCERALKLKPSDSEAKRLRAYLSLK